MGRLEAVTALERAAKICPNPVEIVGRPDEANWLIAVDVRPADLPVLLEKKKVILVPHQARSARDLNNYLRECNLRAGKRRDSMKEVKLWPREEFDDRWWPLYMVLFNWSVGGENER